MGEDLFDCNQLFLLFRDLGLELLVELRNFFLRLLEFAGPGGVSSVSHGCSAVAGAGEGRGFRVT